MINVDERGGLIRGRHIALGFDVSPKAVRGSGGSVVESRCKVSYLYLLQSFFLDFFQEKLKLFFKLFIFSALWNVDFFVHI